MLISAQYREFLEPADVPHVLDEQFNPIDQGVKIIAHVMILAAISGSVLFLSFFQDFERHILKCVKK